ALRASPLGIGAACRCSSWSLATHAGQRLRWNFASRCARYLSTAKCWNSCSCPHARTTSGRATILPEGSAIFLFSSVGRRGILQAELPVGRHESGKGEASSREYLLAILQALAGVESARVVLAKARQRHGQGG